ncbi:MAG: hypothetical protein LBQ59_01300 [Candidatus Peribacteria bacterium]|nr:hypothetical protein [Candidatus Peribacteria bacterium]
MYDGRVKEELGDLLDNDFGNKYDEVMKKVAEYKFNERLGKIKLTSLSDDMKKIIEDKWDIKEEEETVKTVLDYFIGELNALDDFLKENPDDPEKIAQKADIEKYIKDIINGIKKDDSFKDYVNYLGHIALSNIKDWFK